MTSVGYSLSGVALTKKSKYLQKLEFTRENVTKPYTWPDQTALTLIIH